jgi:hypothetical protein
MSDLGELEELISYLVRTSRLSPQEARRLVDEVVSFFDEAPEAFVRRRHRALQAEGLSNAAIFVQLKRELAQRRFRCLEYTDRQIRRIIYG